MTGGQAEAVEHPRTQILILSGLFSIDALIYIGLDQSAFVISSDIADYFDGYPCGIVISGNVAARAVTAMITTLSRDRHSAATTTTSPPRTAADFLALDNPPECAHAHVPYYAIFILPAMDQCSRLAMKVSNCIVVR
jgi:hypothetical protein